ncbi:MAG: ribosome silencing factor [Phycisphaerae bacterium]
MGRRAIDAKRQARARKEAAGAAAPARRRKPPAPAVSLEFARAIARLLSEDKCDDIVVLDLRGRSSVCDYFVIGTGTSHRQMRAAADHVDELATPRGERLFTSAGLEDGLWVVLDYVDVVVHLFNGVQRTFYELETLWGEAPRVEWR